MSGALVVGYEGQVCRAPVERGAYTVPVSVGCPYNRCKFCTLFKHLDHRLIPIEDIERDLARVASMGGAPRRAFLGDGCAFALPYDRLTEILRMVRRYLPSCEEINMDATVTSIARRTDEQLRVLRGLGVRRLYIGIESGLDDVLAMMDKDHDSDGAREAARRLADADILYDAHIMTGVAGRGRGIENAEATASILLETGASRVINFSMFISRRSPLYAAMERAEVSFAPASELENLEEARRLIELLSSGGRRILYDGYHDRIGVRVRGYLPSDEMRMTAWIDRVIDRMSLREPLDAVVDEYPEEIAATACV